MITFSCTSCNTKLVAADEMAGAVVKCTVCQAPVTVPIPTQPPQSNPPPRRDPIKQPNLHASASPSNPSTPQPNLSNPNPNPAHHGVGTILGSTPSSFCPICGSEVSADLTICPQCNFQMVDTRPLYDDDSDRSYSQNQYQGSFAGALAAGFFASIITGLAWAGIVITTGYPLGYVSIAVGLIGGWVAASIAKQKSFTLTASIALFVVLGILSGKAAIYQWGLPEIYARQGATSPEILQVAVINEFIDKGIFDQDIADSLKDIDWQKTDPNISIARSDYRKVSQRINELDAPQRIAITKKYWIEPNLSSLSTSEKLKLTLTWQDGIWSLLAVLLASVFFAGYKQ